MGKGLPDKKSTNQSNIPIVTVMAPKGGVGKTTAVLNYSSVLSKGLRVLALDCDPQCNLSQTILEMLMRDKFPRLSDDSRDTLTRQIAGRIIHIQQQQPQYHEADIVLLKTIPSAEELEEKSTALQAKDVNTLLFYTSEDSHSDSQSEASESDEEAEASESDEEAEASESDEEAEASESDEDEEIKQLYVRYITSAGFTKKSLGHLNDYFKDDRWESITSENDLDETEKNNLLAEAYLVLDQPVTSIQDQILLTLVKKPVAFIKPEQLETFSEFTEGFIVTTDEDDDWKIIHRLPQKDKDVSLDELDAVQEILSDLTDVPIENIPLSAKDAMSVAMASGYSIRNIVDAFDPERLAENPVKHFVEGRAQATDVFKIKPQADSDGEVMLLAGSYFLQLVLGSKFSFGIKALNEGPGSVISPFSAMIFALNHYIREVAALHQADVVLIDINPGSHDLNAVLCMISDGLVGVLNPEAYSDHAMMTMDVILSRWAKQFAPLYARQRPHPAGSLISSPPYFLGYSLQKVPKIGRDIQGAAKIIAKEIRDIFEKNVVPALKENNLFPSFGILDLDEQAQLYADINRFTQQTVALQKQQGVIATEHNRIMHDLFAKTVQRLLGPFFKHWSDRAPRLSQFLPTIDPNALPFERLWAEHYRDKFLKSPSRPQAVLNSPAYLYDIDDMTWIILEYRKQLLSSGHALTSACPPNAHQAILIDPCIHPCEISGDKNSRIKETVDAAFKAVDQNWDESHKVKLAILPIFTGARWVCVRVEFDWDAQKLSILFDDPQGALIDKRFQGAAKKLKRTPVLHAGLLQKVIHAFSSIMSERLPRSAAGRKSHVHTTTLLTKTVDQQGRFMNHAQSGVIVVSNIQDYLTPLHGQIPPNKAFKDAFTVARINDVIAINDMAQWVAVNAPPEVQGVKLSCPPFKANKNGDPTEELIKARTDCTNIIRAYRAKQPATVPGHIRQQFIKAQVKWIEGELFRVLSQYHVLTADFLTSQKSFSLAKLLYQLRLRVFNPSGSRARSSDYASPKDTFPTTLTETVLRKLGALSTASIKDMFKSKTRSSLSKKHACSDSSFTITTGRRGKAQKYQRLPVAADGDCGFNAFGITRSQAYDFLIDDGIKSGANQAEVLGILRPVLSELIIDADFVDYLCTVSSGQSGDLIQQYYQTYLQTGSSDDLESWVDANLQSVMTVYLDYDVMDRKIDNGWCHPLVLHALAYIRKISLYLWKLDSAGKLVPNKSDHYDYSEMKSPGARQSTHILFVNNNHFELLDPIGHDSIKSPVPSGQATPSSARRLSQRVTPGSAGNSGKRPRLSQATNPHVLFSSPVSTASGSGSSNNSQINTNGHQVNKRRRTGTSQVRPHASASLPPFPVGNNAHGATHQSDTGSSSDVEVRLAHNQSHGSSN